MGDHACGVAIRCSNRGVVAMLNPYEFCATTWGSAFLASELFDCAKFVASMQRGGDEAPCLHHTSLRLRAKSSKTRAILLLIADVSEHLWPGWLTCTARTLEDQAQICGGAAVRVSCDRTRIPKSGAVRA
jgi:hypothetical protein